MTCPDCGGIRTEVRETMNMGEILIRQRGCKECGVRWVTEESIRHIYRAKASYPRVPTGTPPVPTGTPSKERRALLLSDLSDPDLRSEKEPEKSAELPKTAKLRPVKSDLPELSGPVVMTFPTAGKVATWDLRQPLVDEMRSAYPDLDVTGECSKARLWCETNRAKRKTARGMPAFLASWLGRAQDRGRAPGKPVFIAPRAAGPMIKPAPEPSLCLWHMYKREYQRDTCSPKCRWHEPGEGIARV